MSVGREIVRVGKCPTIVVNARRANYSIDTALVWQASRGSGHSVSCRLPRDGTGSSVARPSPWGVSRPCVTRCSWATPSSTFTTACHRLIYGVCFVPHRKSEINLLASSVHRRWRSAVLPRTTPNLLERSSAPFDDYSRKHDYLACHWLFYWKFLLLCISASICRHAVAGWLGVRLSRSCIVFKF